MKPTLLVLLALAFGGSPANAAPGPIAWTGLHGGVFAHIEEAGRALGVPQVYLSDQETGKRDLSDFAVLIVQDNPGSNDPDKLIAAAKAARLKRPDFKLVVVDEGRFEKVLKAGVGEASPELLAYYRGSGPENLKNMVAFAAHRFLQVGPPPPPPIADDAAGFYHPKHPDKLPDLDAFLAWSRTQGRPLDGPRVLVVAHQVHLKLQQPKVVAALVAALEQRGALVAVLVDNVPGYEARALAFSPKAVIHTCHSTEKVAFREQLGAIHLSSVFFRRESIADWKKNPGGFRGGFELFGQIIAQELIGGVEPLVGAGTDAGPLGSDEVVPIPDRIEHIAERALGWARLTRPAKDRRVAFVYYDRELGKAELMRGSATGMYLNGPRSLVRVLQAMKREGYGLSPVPKDEVELLGWMMERGRQIGMWDKAALVKLAQSGDALLIPAADYRRWYEAKVSPENRKALEEKWGPPPGKLSVYTDARGVTSLVIPRIRLGNVVLLPQPLRGEAHDAALVHDLKVPPPHSYLATYFWLQEGLAGDPGVDAMVHFGTHGSEFLLPGKGVGLSKDCWSDIVMGALPNIGVWVINNLGESPPARRRGYATLVDHLVPPGQRPGLDDKLAGLERDLRQFFTLEDGALKERMRAPLGEALVKTNLASDLKLDLKGRAPTEDELKRALDYLALIAEEVAPTRLHVLGQAPTPAERLPAIVVALRQAFLDELNAGLKGKDNAALRRLAEDAVRRFLYEGLTPEEALKSIGFKQKLTPKLTAAFALAKTLDEGYAKAGNEITGLLTALSGRFLSPGPGNSPDLNPAVLPTGRNMFTLNPEEVPSRASYELGRTLTEQLLTEETRRQGRLPEKVALSLSAHATFQDFGVMEGQILTLLGIEPVWDERGVVNELKVIPRAALGRARVDVFVAVDGYYRDLLPTRVKLLDRAVRLASAQEEADNAVRAGTQRMLGTLSGLSPEKAARLAGARFFGPPPDVQGSAGYYYLVERSGEWGNRQDLMKVYLDHHRFAYGTDDVAWGEDGGSAYQGQMQGTSVVLRTWTDRTRSPLSNKYTWFKGGSLAMAIETVTGKRPRYVLSDVRDPGQAKVVDAEEALRQEYHVRLFNQRWIEGMMKEGYAGADQIAVHVSNTLGWAIMRPDSVTPEIWAEITETFVDDRRNLGLKPFFEAENPFAFQEVAEILLEAVRKGYWSPDQATQVRIAKAYAESVANHGEGGGLRGGGNVGLDKLVRDLLASDPEGQEALKRMEARKAEDAKPAEALPTPVEGPVLTELPAEEEAPSSRWPWLIGAAALLFGLGLGIWRKAGAAR